MRELDMRLIKKMLIATTAASLISVVAAVPVNTAAERACMNYDREKEELLARTGYYQANEKSKEAAIMQLAQQYAMGMISKSKLDELVKQAKITDLDIDNYVQNYASSADYEKYLCLKEDMKASSITKTISIWAFIGGIVVGGASYYYSKTMYIEDNKEEINSQTEETC